MKMNTFRLDLSIGTEIVKSKEDGKLKTKFEYQQNISLDEKSLTEIFTNYNQSVNI